MDEKFDKACKAKIAMLGAQLQKSRIKKDSLREALNHEEERHMKILGGIEHVTDMMERNANA